MAELLKLEDLSVEIMSSYGVINAVRNVNLSLQEGSIHGLVGESGCGKSITARTIMGLHDKRLVRLKGHIWFEGKDLLTLSDREMSTIRGRRIGMVFQDPMTSLDPLYKVGDQISEVFRRHFHNSKATARKKTLDLLEKVHILPAEARYEQYPFEFSGGMLQRAIIAIAIATNPRLIIADEPTTSLDVTIQAQILELLQQLQKELGIAVLMITHNFGIVSEMCDYVSVMYAGSIFETGSKKDVFTNTANPYSAALMASIPRRGSTEGRLTTIPGAPPELFDKIPGCAFAPRCSLATGICFTETPLLKPCRAVCDASHLAACHHIPGGLEA